MQKEVAHDLDLVIAHGDLVDGKGPLQHDVDVAVRGDRIVAIAPGGSLEAPVIVEAAGRVVCPGFIDVHSHADYTILLDGRGQSALMQGVTSIVTGNCGHGIAPVTAQSRKLVSMNIAGWRRESALPITWSSFGEYLSLLRDRGVGPNVFPLVAHGTIRLGISGFRDRQLSDAEVTAARQALHDALAAGAVGMSTGLEYAPGISATTDELTRIAEAAADFNVVYATHCRNRSDRMAEAAQEAVDVARAGRMRLQMSHYVRRPYASDDMVGRAWAHLDQASRDGMTVRADVFPFDYGPTPLSALIPPSMFADTREEMARRLRDPAFKRRIVEGMGGMFKAAIDNDMVDSMFVASDGADGSLTGLSLADLAKKTGLPVTEAAVWLLENAGDNFPCVYIVENWVRWEDLVGALEDPQFFIMGDGATSALDGPASSFAMALADWGYAPRYLSRFVRDMKLVSIEQAIGRMCSGPALQFGLTDRGTVEPGKAADLVVFDARTIGSAVAPHALRQLPTGISHVLVNGQFVVRDGAPSGALPGHVGVRH
ncbi:N-acyl-D-glutamate deacylase (plasmid) [Variovorax sp. SRS16]|uniref:N-acyl-D-amino-acid deacylase family protein n=1 Tax=Variovorax sp. SRS16 TaxID=282217 RepID=UPI0013169284|nr:amidohydrolase family protein [Variovorax sp. SRS16]VTU45864.1 N-acyl-D-glutamate deacylase [Variovorax sp. SRS16]